MESGRLSNVFYRNLSGIYRKTPWSWWPDCKYSGIPCRVFDRTEGFLELFDKKAYKYGIIKILSTVILFCISIFALSFWANGIITGRGGSICEDDGTIWCGTQVGKVENCAKKNVIDEKEIRQFQYPIGMIGRAIDVNA